MPLSAAVNNQEGDKAVDGMTRTSDPIPNYMPKKPQQLPNTDNNPKDDDDNRGHDKAHHDGAHARRGEVSTDKGSLYSEVADEAKQQCREADTDDDGTDRACVSFHRFVRRRG